MHTIQVLYRPHDFFADLRVHPYLVRRFLFITLLNFAVILLYAGVSGSRSITGEAVQFFGVLPAFLVVSNLVSWGMLSLFIVLASRVLFQDTTPLRSDLKATFSVITVAHLIPALASYVALSVGLLTVSRTDLTLSQHQLLGLDDLLRFVTQQPQVIAFAEQITVFSLWYLALLVWGLVTLRGGTRSQALVLAGAVWLLEIGYQSGLLLG